MTKITNLVDKQTKKPIEFLFYVCDVVDDKFMGTYPVGENKQHQPSSWDNISLIKDGYKPPFREKNYSVMYAYNDLNPTQGTIFLGWFNDGVV